MRHCPLVLVLTLLAPTLALAQGSARTPNLNLKYTNQQLLNDNFTKIDDWAGQQNLVEITVTLPPFNVPNNGTDAYAALQAVATYVNTLCANGQGALVRFPPGTYTIDQYRITGGASANSIRNIVYQGCRGLVLSGYGAKIDVKGNINRTQDSGSTSYTNALIPIVVYNSSDVVIEGFEIDGNVDQATRDSGALESNFNPQISVPQNVSNHLILTADVDRYVLQDLYLHHAIADGVLLGFGTSAASIVDHFGTVERVTSQHNGRQGLTVAFARYITIADSDLSYTGDTDGAYTRHGPSAGIDIEPTFCAVGQTATECTGTTAVADEPTGEIVVTNTRLWGNVGGAIFAYVPRIANVLFDHVDIRDDASAAVAHMAVVACKGCTLQNSYINASGFADAAVWPVWTDNQLNADVRILNNTFEGDERGLRIATYDGQVLIDGNTFRYTGTGTISAFFPSIQATTDSNIQFTRNVIEFPPTAHDGVTSDQAALLQGIKFMSGNSYKIGQVGADASFDAICTASTAPYPCCTGAGTGTCDSTLNYTIDYTNSNASNESYLSGELFGPSDTSWVNGGPYAFGRQAVSRLNIPYLPSQTVASDGAGTAATFTITPTRSVHRITCNDTDGCAATMSETGVSDGDVLIIENISANTVTIADSSGVVETTGGTSISLAQYETAGLIYLSDRWTQLFTN